MRANAAFQRESECKKQSHPSGVPSFGFQDCCGTKSDFPYNQALFESQVWIIFLQKKIKGT